MAVKFADKARAEYVKKIFDFVESLGEDVGMIESNSFNFPIVIDGEEGFVEVVVKVPKDRGDDNYMKRETYADKVRERKERAEKAAAKKKSAEEKTEK
jgi:hypothetical protein